ncbi:MAG: hypothetical protein SFV23_20625 [Planctomycetaceae bacterium]|nr:hypothetical protein [Planctomycetaceae bacterium]
MPRKIGLLGLAAACGFLVWSGYAWSQAQTVSGLKRGSLSTVMREKLDAAALILEGICTEDDQAILRGSGTLSDSMSKPELFEVFTDAEYREFNREFRDTARRLGEAAKNKNFDQATLRYVDVTLACVECHNHVRAKRKDK